MKTFFNTRSASKVWSSAELQQLRTLATAGTAVTEIAVRLRRSVSAVRNKAGMHGISLRSAGRENAAPIRQVEAQRNSNGRPAAPP